MYHKVVSVIPPVCHFISAERHIADHTVKKAVRVLCRFKSLHRNFIFLVKLFRNLPGNAVKLHAVHLQAVHRLRYKPHEIPDGAGRLQHVALL